MRKTILLSLATMVLSACATTYAQPVNNRPTYDRFMANHHQDRKHYRHQMDRYYGRDRQAVVQHFGRPDTKINEGHGLVKLVYKRTKSREFRDGWYKLSCKTVFRTKHGVVNDVKVVGNNCTDRFMVG